MSRVVEDFGRIAALPESRWDHNCHYHRWLLRQLGRGERALEVGCGRGRFCVELSRRFESVTGLDITPAMIEEAQRRCAGMGRIRLETADFGAWQAGGVRFDAIACIATLHHLPLEESLEKMKALLAPGGRIAILDLYRQQGAGLLLNVLVFPLNLVLQIFKTGRLRPPAAVRAAWREHGRTDRYSTVAELRAAAARVLPGARVRAHLLWRCSLVWRMPG